MKLFTEELKEMFVDYPLYSQSEVEDPLVIVKFFDPCGSATWFLTELDVETKTGFGLVTGLQVDELGYVSIDELESIKRPFGLTIERDLYFKQDRLNEIKKQYSS